MIEQLELDQTNAVWLVSHEGEQRVPASRVRRTVQADYLKLVSGGMKWYRTVEEEESGAGVARKR